MHSYRTDILVSLRPERVWDALHQGETVAILWDQRIRQAITLDGERNRVGWRIRYDLMTHAHDSTLSLLAELVAQTPYSFQHWRFSFSGATYNLRCSWKPYEMGSQLSVVLETNFEDPFLNLRLLFGKRRYTAAYNERFAELRQWLEQQND